MSPTEREGGRVVTYDINFALLHTHKHVPLTDRMLLSDINEEKLQLISSAVKQVIVLWQPAEQKSNQIKNSFIVK